MFIFLLKILCLITLCLVNKFNKLYVQVWLGWTKCEMYIPYELLYNVWFSNCTDQIITPIYQYVVLLARASGLLLNLFHACVTCHTSNLCLVVTTKALLSFPCKFINSWFTEVSVAENSLKCYCFQSISIQRRWNTLRATV